MTNAGDLKETRWILVTLIEPDLDQAGEINPVRALRQGGDRWAYGAG